MPFNSLPYLVLLVVVVVVHWLLPIRFRRVFVLSASLAFYASWSLIFLWVPLMVAGLVYLIGTQIVKGSTKAKMWLWLGIIALLSLLILFKYAGLVAANLNHLAGWVSAPHFSLATAVAFPIGISFYTFEAIAYLFDVRQCRVKMPKFLDLVLFFLFWPNVLSGPLVRARELMPQLSFNKPFEARFFFEGLDRLIWGLVQKVVIANVLGIWVDRGYSPSVMSRPLTLDGWFLAIAFGLQIYFDFAGYTNMAIGTARLLGVTLPENFRQPYYASTPPEFWARWHMTLSRWIRDYLFFPMNAKWQGAPWPLYTSLLVVMALVGLWHGTGWNFILWGALHGSYLVLYRMYESWKPDLLAPGSNRIVGAIWRVLTLVAVASAWVVFRAPNLAKAGMILSSMFFRFAAGRMYGAGFYAFTLTAVVFCAVEPLLLQKLNEVEERAGTNGPSPFRVVVRPLAYLFGLLLFLLFDQNNPQFIYSQF
jgi:alginate O-acetyltransferase complex protein AlgI